MRVKARVTLECKGKEYHLHQDWFAHPDMMIDDLSEEVVKDVLERQLNDFLRELALNYYKASAWGNRH